MDDYACLPGRAIDHAHPLLRATAAIESGGIQTILMSSLYLGSYSMDIRLFRNRLPGMGNLTAENETLCLSCIYQILHKHGDVNKPTPPLAPASLVRRTENGWSKPRCIGTRTTQEPESLSNELIEGKRGPLAMDTGTGVISNAGASYTCPDISHHVTFPGYNLSDVPGPKRHRIHDITHPSLQSDGDAHASCSCSCSCSARMMANQSMTPAASRFDESGLSVSFRSCVQYLVSSPPPQLLPQPLLLPPLLYPELSCYPSILSFHMLLYSRLSLFSIPAAGHSQRG